MAHKHLIVKSPRCLCGTLKDCEWHGYEPPPAPSPLPGRIGPGLDPIADGKDEN